jgi:beta-lactamase class A
VVILVLAGAAVLYYANKGVSPMEANQSAPSEKQQQDQADPAAAIAAELEPKINEVIKNYPAMDISVAVADIHSGALLQYGKDEPFHAASTSKLLTAISYLRLVEEEEAHLDDNIGGLTARRRLQKLIEDSDQAAWEELNGRLGHSRLWADATMIGLSGYNPNDNSIKASDIAVLLRRLYTGQLLNPEHTALLLEFMNKAGETEHIVDAIPSEAKVFHKAGWLSDRFHDAAVIDNGKRPYVLVIFSKTSGQYNSRQGKELFRQLTAATVEVFFKAE